MASSSSFPQFASLPAEIQLQIWESTAAALPTMQMHLFDVRAPLAPPPEASHISTLVATAAAAQQKARLRQRGSSSNTTRVRKSVPPPRDSRRAARRETVTLEAFSCTAAEADGQGHRDPSGYRLRDALRATCTDAADAVRRARRAVPPADRAAVLLSSGRAVEYDAARDVLHLRFLAAADDDNEPSGPRAPGGNGSPEGRVTMTKKMSEEQEEGCEDAPAPTTMAPLSAIFRSVWSHELAAALHGARRVAIDVGQVWPELADEQTRLVQDIVFLACTLQHDLEVLYLVDNSAPGRSSPSPSTSSSCPSRARKRPAEDLSARDGELYGRLHYRSDDGWEHECSREGDVVHGVGRVWREVFDLEGLGWHERHPGFVFGEMFGEVVRLQQGNWYGEGRKKATFKGVRVLVAEDE